MGVITASNKSNGASPLERLIFQSEKIIVFVGIFPNCELGRNHRRICSMQRLNALPLPGRARLFCCVGMPGVPPAAFLPGLAPEDFRRSFRILPVGRFFVGGSAGTPVALLPHIDVALLDPFARQPDIARMRTRPPMAGHPNPLAAPVPLAGNEIPKRRGARRRGNNFFPVRRRRLGGLSDVGAVRRSDLRLNGNGTFDHATRWQQQADGHQETFGWNGIFHILKFGN